MKIAQSRGGRTVLDIPGTTMIIIIFMYFKHISQKPFQFNFTIFPIAHTKDFLILTTMKSAGIMKYLMRPIDIEASQFSKAPHSFSEFVTGIYQTSISRIIDAVITVLDMEMIF